MSEVPRSLPAPQWTITRWLSTPACDPGPEGGAELRRSMFRRLEAVLVSAVMTLIIAATALIHRPGLPFLIWFGADALVFSVRAPLVGAILFFMRRRAPGRPPPHAMDLFIVLGTVWSSVLGMGCFICLWKGDTALSILATLLAAVTAGAQAVRSLASPRMNSLQMSLVLLPFAAGVWASGIPLRGFIVSMVPLFLLANASIALQLHQDFVALIVARAETRRRALHCSLTGLPNRALFTERLQAAVGEGPRVLSILYMDLDGFKAVNDSLGHARGDELLQHVAQRLTAVLQDDGVVARLGGDEFAALLPGDRAMSQRLATRIIEAVSQPFALADGLSAAVGISIGIATFHKAGATEVGRLIDQADRALYRAKRAGRGTFHHVDGEAAALAA